MARRNTSQKRYVVHCLVQRLSDSQWQAFSLEYGLAVQADSCPEAKNKLDVMIQSYLYDALVGEDRAHAHELLSRRAHWRMYLRYGLAYLQNTVDRQRSRDTKLFRESLGIPQLCI